MGKYCDSSPDSKLLSDVLIELSQRVTEARAESYELRTSLTDTDSQLRSAEQSLESLRVNYSELEALQNEKIQLLSRANNYKIGIMDRTIQRENLVIKEMEDWLTVLQKGKPPKNTQRTNLIKYLNAWVDHLSRGPLHESVGNGIADKPKTI